MKNIKQYIADYKNDFYTKSGSVTAAEIKDAEKNLNCVFDGDYTSYLKEFGLISYESIEFAGLGVPFDSYINVCQATHDAKEAIADFPENTVVLESVGEKNWIVYKMKSGIYQLSLKGMSLIDTSMESFMLSRFDESK